MEVVVNDQLITVDK